MATTPTNGNRGGYDYLFVNTPPDELVCKICHHPSREPHLSVCCGHTFCKTCLEDAKQAVTVDEEVKNSCPLCREKNFSAFQNKRDERAVKSLHVFCTNKDKGCDWQGELNNIVGHLVNSDGCPFEEVSCINECGFSLQRQNLSKHIDIECPRSKVICQYCCIVRERQFITGKHHEVECPKFPLPCPNKCKIKTIPRENMKVHRAECPLEMIQCKCNLSLQRQLLSKHVDTVCPRSKVTCQYCNTIGERQFINGQHQKEECSKFPLPCPNNCKVGTVLRENMEAHRAECPLEMIQCEYYEMGCKDSMARKDKVKHNKEEVENHLSLMKSEYLQTKDKLVNTEKTVTTTKSKLAETENQLSLLKFEYLQIKDKLADAEKTVITTKNKLADTTTKCELTNAAAEKRIKELENSMEDRIQLVENMMFKHVFQWYATLEERVKSQHTKVPVTLKMSDYSKKKKSNSVWCSDSFSWELPLFDQYPELKLQVIPAGYRRGKGTHLSVQLYLVKGGCKEDFLALERQIECQLQSLMSQCRENEDPRRFWWRTMVVKHKDRESQTEEAKEIERWKKRERLENERKELREKQKLWEKNSLVRLYVVILNQIIDGEQHCVQTNQIDLKVDHFLTNKDCNVLIFNSPCFISNETLYKSTATCRYLQGDNVYFLIKAA